MPVAAGTEAWLEGGNLVSLQRLTVPLPPPFSVGQLAACLWNPAVTVAGGLSPHPPSPPPPPFPHASLHVLPTAVGNYTNQEIEEWIIRCCKYIQRMFSPSPLNLLLLLLEGVSMAPLPPPCFCLLLLQLALQFTNPTFQPCFPLPMTLVHACGKQ